MRLTTLAAAAAFALLGASQALAGDASCIWGHLPAAQREAMLTDYQTQQLKALDPGRFGNQAIGQAERACGVGEDNGEAAGKALSAIMFQLASERWLAANASLDASKLDAAWAAMDRGARAKLVDAAKEGTIGKALGPALNPFEVQLGLPPSPPGLKAGTSAFNLTIYLLGRSQRAAFEPQF